MPRIPVEVDDREYSEALKVRGDQKWRKVILEALGIDETPRRIGRPPRAALDSLQIGSGISLEAGETLARAVEDFGEDVFAKAQRERERRKAGG